MCISTIHVRYLSHRAEVQPLYDFTSRRRLYDDTGSTAIPYVSSRENCIEAEAAVERENRGQGGTIVVGWVHWCAPRLCALYSSGGKSVNE